VKTPDVGKKKWFLSHILVSDKKLYNCMSEENNGHLIIKYVYL
jgi:hypothetical protein